MILTICSVGKTIESTVAILITGTKAAHDRVEAADFDEGIVGTVRIISAGARALVLCVQVVAQFVGEHGIRTHGPVAEAIVVDMNAEVRVVVAAIAAREEFEHVEGLKIEDWY